MAEGFSIHVEGISEFVGALTAKIAAVEVANKLAVVKAANLLKQTAQTALALRSHPKGTWSPSPPGDAPALVTGALRRSINVNVEKGLDGVSARVGPSIIYGRIQELGGNAGRGGHVHLPPRPYMQPSLTYSLPAMAVIYREAWAGAMKL